MAFSRSLLKPAALLLVGAAAVFGSTAAQAVTFNWDLTTQGLYSGSVVQRTGSGTLGATLISGTTYQIQSISGTWNGEAITGLLTSVIKNGSTFTFDNQFTTNGANQFRPASGIGYAFSTQNYWVSAFAGARGLIFPLDESNTNGVGDVSIFTAQEVPAPLPLLGLPAVLFYSRRLKKRIQQHNALAVVS